MQYSWLLVRKAVRFGYTAQISQWSTCIYTSSHALIMASSVSRMCITAFYSIYFFIRAVFSAVFSLTFLLIDVFPVLLSVANKDSFIHSF